MVSVIIWGHFTRNIRLLSFAYSHNSSPMSYRARRRATNLCRTVQALRRSQHDIYIYIYICLPMCVYIYIYVYIMLRLNQSTAFVLVRDLGADARGGGTEGGKGANIVWTRMMAATKITWIPTHPARNKKGKVHRGRRRLPDMNTEYLLQWQTTCMKRLAGFNVYCCFVS